MKAAVTRIAALLLMTAFAGGTAWADEARQIMFAEAEEARAAALDARANLLAPDSFEDGQAAFDSAAEGYDRGRSLERIRKSLIKATESFRLSVAVAKRALTPLTPALEARAKADEAGRHRVRARRPRSGSEACSHRGRGIPCR